MTEQNNTPADDATNSRRPDYNDYRDANGTIDWRAFRAAVAAWTGDDGPGGVEFIATGE